MLQLTCLPCCDLPLYLTVQGLKSQQQVICMTSCERLIMQMVM